MNRKTLISATAAILFACTSTSSLAFESSAFDEKHIEQIKQESKSVLMAKLSQLNFFTANFSQQVLSESAELIEQSTGKLAISKPNLANWQVLTPDELSIVSDGDSVWFYNPWIEQVSVYSLSAAIARTPILLLTSKDEALWQEYQVQQEGQDTFIISAIDPNSQIKSLTLVFAQSAQGEQLTQFSFHDATGQVSHIKLTEFDNKQAPAQSLFQFELPQGTQVDDQR